MALSDRIGPLCDLLLGAAYARALIHVYKGDDYVYWETVQNATGILIDATDGLRVVSDGLKSGDRVIVRGIQKVFPGIKVTVEPPPSAVPQPGGPT